MPQRQCCFLVVLMLIFCTKIFGQNVTCYKTAYKEAYSIAGKNYSPGVKTDMITPEKIFQNVEKKLPRLYSITDFQLSKHYYSGLGFFCRKELQLQKITSIPFRFRLGSLNYVNWLEQKPNYSKPF
jgi:hypothetical protein